MAVGSVKHVVITVHILHYEGTSGMPTASSYSSVAFNIHAKASGGPVPLASPSGLSTHGGLTLDRSYEIRTGFAFSMGVEFASVAANASVQIITNERLPEAMSLVLHLEKNDPPLVSVVIPLLC